jgi:hypothetical protein
MAFGMNSRKVRKRRDTSISELARKAQRREESLRKKLDKEEAGLEEFVSAFPIFGERILNLRALAAGGYQMPRSTYDVNLHSGHIFGLAYDMSKDPKASKALNKVYGRNKTGGKFLPLTRACSVPGFDNKRLSSISRDVSRRIERKDVPKGLQRKTSDSG